MESKEKKKVRFTTINSDAGVKNGIGAVAYWIRSDDKWYSGSQRLKTENPTPNYAELSGIIIALSVAAKDPFLSTADRFVVNCDNQWALGTLKGERPLPDIFVPHFEAITKIIPKNKITFKWVKGHLNNGQSRNWINNWCDKEVRKHY